MTAVQGLDERAKGVSLMTAAPSEDDGALDLERAGNWGHFGFEKSVLGLVLMDEVPKSTEDLVNLCSPLLCHKFQPGWGLALLKEPLCTRSATRSATASKPGPVFDVADGAEMNRLMGHWKMTLVKWGEAVDA